MRIFSATSGLAQRMQRIAATKIALLKNPRQDVGALLFEVFKESGKGVLQFMSHRTNGPPLTRGQ